MLLNSHRMNIINLQIYSQGQFKNANSSRNCHIEDLIKICKRRNRVGPVVNFIKGQRVQWLGRGIMRESKNECLRIIIMEWKPQGKIPRSRP